MEDNRTRAEEHTSPRPNAVWLAGVGVVLLIATVIAFGYSLHQRAAVSQLSAQNQDLSATVSQLRGEIDTLTAKLSQMNPPPAPEGPPANASAANAGPAGANRTAGKHRGTADTRWKKFQARLDEQQKQLKETQEEVASTKSEFEGRLNSTRDELNGSIAKNHEELVALAKRGERNYFEFDLPRSKQFQREGPIMLSLRKADAKHKYYDLALIVDDNQLGKKKVNLYEPVWIHRTDDAQPVQVVVNRIDKNHVHGYVSAPKYRESELAAGAAANLTPVSATTSSTSQSGNSENQQPQQQPQPPQ